MLFSSRLSCWAVGEMGDASSLLLISGADDGGPGDVLCAAVDRLELGSGGGAGLVVYGTGPGPGAEAEAESAEDDMTCMAPYCKAAIS